MTERSLELIQNKSSFASSYFDFGSGYVQKQFRELGTVTVTVHILGYVIHGNEYKSNIFVEWFGYENYPLIL